MTSRKYYISDNIANQMTQENAAIECIMQDKEFSATIYLSVNVEETGNERARHGLAILYKTATISNYNFQLLFNMVDYGTSGYDFGNQLKINSVQLDELLKEDVVLLYDESEKDSDTIIFYETSVLVENGEVTIDISNTTTNRLNINEVTKALEENSMVILPVMKNTHLYDNIGWSTNSKCIYRFHENYMPIVYNDIAKVLKDRVVVPKDFIEYEYFIMNKKNETDALNNTWVSLSYLDCINAMDLLELDNTGKTHMYVLDNYKDVDKKVVYDSFINLELSNIALDTSIRVIEIIQPESTKWFEDHILSAISKDKSYHFSDYINPIVKYVRASKKSKDRNINQFLNMMLDKGRIDGYARILKALKLSNEELLPYLERLITLDKESSSAGYHVISFIREWKTESFDILEDYIFEGIKTQDIYKSTLDNYNNRKVGLNSLFDYSRNFLYLLDIKCVNKKTLIERFLEGVKEDLTHFLIKPLLKKIKTNILNPEWKAIIPQFAQCVIDYDSECEYVLYFLSKEKIEEVKKFMYISSSYNSYSYYTPEFEQYSDAFINMLREKNKRANSWSPKY